MPIRSQFALQGAVPATHELEFHFRCVAEVTRLPIMLYNNPPAYRVRSSPAAAKHAAPRPSAGASQRPH